MPVAHEEIMARAPKARQARIKTRAAELHAEVEGLKAKPLTFSAKSDRFPTWNGNPSSTG